MFNLKINQFLFLYIKFSFIIELKVCKHVMQLESSWIDILFCNQSKKKNSLTTLFKI